MNIIRPRAPLRIQPPLIPIIDIVFNLLMFFMLTPSTSSGQGFLTTNLPVSSGPVPGKPTLTEVRIRVELYDVGPNGRFVDGAKNEYCAIKVEQQDLGTDFGALRTYLQNKREQGVPTTTPILIAPTMGTLHEWVVRAFDAAVAARFANVQFAVPYQ
jgi:biopolymer transport protein ExbD